MDRSVLPRGALLRRLLALLLCAATLQAGAAELRVASSGGFAPAYKLLAPAFERTTGDTLVSEWGPSMGETPNAIPKRLARGEPIDVVIMVGSALDDLIGHGDVVADSKVLLARSRIAVAVRAGAPKPDIGTVDALRATLLAAKSIAYSDSASGVYLQDVLFPRLGIADRVRGKARMIPAEPVGQVVARGDAELGFQQLSELKAVAGIDIVGLIPADVQQVTLFSAGITTRSHDPKAARALLDFLSASGSAATIDGTGLEAARR